MAYSSGGLASKRGSHRVPSRLQFRPLRDEEALQVLSGILVSDRYFSMSFFSGGEFLQDESKFRYWSRAEVSD
jgi:hypothetical protein